MEINKRHNILKLRAEMDKLRPYVDQYEELKSKIEEIYSTCSHDNCVVIGSRFVKDEGISYDNVVCENCYKMWEEPSNSNNYLTRDKKKELLYFIKMIVEEYEDESRDFLLNISGDFLKKHEVERSEFLKLVEEGIDKFL